MTRFLRLSFLFLLAALSIPVESRYSSKARPISEFDEFAEVVNKTIRVNLTEFVVPEYAHSYTNYQYKAHNAAVLDSQIKVFLEKLKRFITRTEFKSVAFEKNGPRLERVLKSLEGKAKEFVSSEKLSLQIIIVRRVYYELIRIASELEHYRMLFKVADSVLYKIIEIKALALALLNVYGELDLSIKDAPRRVTWLWRNLLFWKVVFEDLKTTMKDHWVVFRYEVNDTEAFLKDMARFIPSN